MRGAGVGRIINIGTNLVQNPVVPYHDYTAAKAALLSFTRTLPQDLGPDGITVNMVSGARRCAPSPRPSNSPTPCCSSPAPGRAA
ncbi:hypothetical protein G6F40_016983 [Rhizopus arrhizus]|nr:hypothetical protein G6F40_016983 [Rhizopus arrhizus]